MLLLRLHSIFFATLLELLNSYAYIVFHHSTYSLTPDEVARLMRDRMLHGRSEDQSVCLLMYCVNCHALFTKRPGKRTVIIHDLPYEHFPLCPHCQSVDWCPANDAMEQRERREREEQARRWKQAKEEKAKREQEATEAAQMQVYVEAKTIQQTAEHQNNPSREPGHPEHMNTSDILCFFIDILNVNYVVFPFLIAAFLLFIFLMFMILIPA